MTNGNRDESTKGLVKVLFELKPDERVGSIMNEIVWAQPVTGDLYRLRNVPMYLYGFSVEDLVSAVPKDDRLTVTGLAGRGGHSTYRAFLPEDTTPATFEQDFIALASLGCTFERATRLCVGIDVPPEADVYAVYRALEEGEKAQRWTFEEGHCGHRVRPE